jgi:hypothetical protein
VEEVVIKFVTIEMFKGGIIIDNFGRKAVDKEHGSRKSFIPKL